MPAEGLRQEQVNSGTTVRAYVQATVRYADLVKSLSRVDSTGLSASAYTPLRILLSPSLSRVPHPPLVLCDASSTSLSHG